MIQIHFIDDVFTTVTVVVSFGKIAFFILPKNSGGGGVPLPLLQAYLFLHWALVAN